MFDTSTKILAQYSHMPSFEAIRLESESIMHDMRDSLRSQLQHVEHADGTRQIDIAILLLRLGVDPTLLWHDLFSMRCPGSTLTDSWLTFR